MSLIRRFLRDERGATAIEYVLIASLLSLAIVTGATLIGTRLAPLYSNAANGIK